jgi:hypothetical protein
VEVGDTRLARVDDHRGAQFLRESQPYRVNVGHDDLGRSEGKRCLNADEPDRSRAGDENSGASGDPGLHTCPDADREGLEQGGGVIAHAVGHRVGEGLVHDDVFGERAVNGWGPEEAHVRAEVVPPGQTLSAGQVRNPGLDGYAFADDQPRDTGPKIRHLARGLMTQHERGLDDETPDTPVLVVVSVRPAHPDSADPDDDLPRTGPGKGTLLDDDGPRFA